VHYNARISHFWSSSLVRYHRRDTGCTRDDILLKRKEWTRRWISLWTGDVRRHNLHEWKEIGIYSVYLWSIAAAYWAVRRPGKHTIFFSLSSRGVLERQDWWSKARLFSFPRRRGLCGANHEPETGVSYHARYVIYTASIYRGSTPPTTLLHRPGITPRLLPGIVGLHPV
jgi:hypothetical protein